MHYTYKIWSSCNFGEWLQLHCKDAFPSLFYQIFKKPSKRKEETSLSVKANKKNPQFQLYFLTSSETVLWSEKEVAQEAADSIPEPPRAEFKTCQLKWQQHSPP